MKRKGMHFLLILVILVSTFGGTSNTVLGEETSKTEATDSPAASKEAETTDPSETPESTPVESEGAEGSAAKSLVKKDCTGEEVVNVQMRLKDLGYYCYKVTGFYGNYTADAVRKFQEENKLDIDGQVGELTKKVLYSSSAVRYTMKENVPVNRSGSSTKYGQLINWFDKGQYIFGRGEVAKVTDMDTGITFRMKRTGGHFHADVEPLTEADTQKILDIWGGWSWDRRAVIVEINGYRIAASMHGYPHAYDYVPDNGMTGHVCIHMYKSRTHIRNKEDPDHQAMVKKAAGMD